MAVGGGAQRPGPDATVTAMTSPTPMSSTETPPTPQGALVLFSGGQDSATCLLWALEKFARVETIGFDYGQRHRVELAQRDVVRRGLAALSPRWAERLGEDHTLALDALGAISETALTRDAEITLSADGLPNTFVPGRNIVFLTFAAALAYRRGLAHLVGGMCETDYSGYPDCRNETIRALEQALNLGMARRFEIHTPLMWIDKAASWNLAEELGGAAAVRLFVEETHSCYLGARDKRFDWGYGCGECPACRLRAAGYEKYLAGKRGAAGGFPIGAA
jgi:7-cyano-7-deazaguanine synthase